MDRSPLWGVWHTVTSAHSGTLDCLDGSFFDYKTSSVSSYVPSGPTIYLNAIIATDPHNVSWQYRVVGTCPYSLNWQLGDYLQINTGSPNGQFTVDQTSYPSGYNYAQITGHMYGVTVFGTGAALSCGVNRVDNYPITTTNTAAVYDGNGDGVAAEFIPVEHIASTNETYFQYGCGVLYYGALQTELWSAMGAINTSGASPESNREIPAINENFVHQGITEPLAFDYASSSLFQIRQNNYPPAWWPSYQAVSICNTVLSLGDYFANAQGCLNFRVI